VVRRQRRGQSAPSSSGALVAVTEGSTKPVTVTVTHAGLAVVEQYHLWML
jgi:hypothetical protein